MRIKDIASQYEDPHTWRGLSSVGYPLGRLYLMWTYGNTLEKPTGIFNIGKVIHEHYQTKVFPAGSVIDDGIEEFGIYEPVEVVAHEVPVFLRLGILFWSPIDTLFYLPKSDKFIIVDYKTSSQNPYSLKEPKKMNVDQINLYSHLFKSPIREDEHPDQIIVYISKYNIYNIKAFWHKYDRELAEKSIRKLVDLANLNAGTLSLKYWHKYVPCLWDNLGFKKPCPAYCDVKDFCLQLFRDEFEQHFRDHDEVRKFMMEHHMR